MSFLLALRENQRKREWNRFCLEAGGGPNNVCTCMQIKSNKIKERKKIGSTYILFSIMTKQFAFYQSVKGSLFSIL
jgi:hypothetical protein